MQEHQSESDSWGGWGGCRLVSREKPEWKRKRGLSHPGSSLWGLLQAPLEVPRSQENHLIGALHKQTSDDFKKTNYELIIPHLLTDKSLMQKQCWQHWSWPGWPHKDQNIWIWKVKMINTLERQEHAHKIIKLTKSPVFKLATINVCTPRVSITERKG